MTPKRCCSLVVVLGLLLAAAPAFSAPPAKLSKVDGGLAVSLDLPPEQQMLLVLLVAGDGKTAHAEFVFWDGKRLDKAAYVLTVAEDKPPPPPVEKLIEAFTLQPESIKRGESATLAWACPKARTVTVNGLSVSLTGSQTLKPDLTTTYTLVASGPTNSETAQRILTVTDTPPPPPPPIPELGLRVLIVEEKDDRGKLSAGQVEILTATAAGSTIDWLNRNCVKDKTGNPEWRIVDDDVTFDQASPLWQAARKKFSELKVPVPGFLVSTGKEGTFGALPATPAEFLKVLEKYVVK